VTADVPAPGPVGEDGPEPVEPEQLEPELLEPELVEADLVEPGLDEPEQPAPLVIRRRGRRVSTEPTPGYIGEPAREQHQSSENDQRLKGDVPPHWG
jgi:hypothetical protein